MKNEETREKVDLLLRREENLRRLSWFSLSIPLAIFFVLFWMVSTEARKLQVLLARKASLDNQVEEQERKLTTDKLALEAVTSQRVGPPPRIVYFRSSIGSQVQAALNNLGFTEIKPEPESENPSLRKKAVDTLAYGCAVSEQDIRLIAAALKSLPIRRIEAAGKNPDPLLVQIIASSKTDSNGPAADLTAWKKGTQSCSAKL